MRDEIRMLYADLKAYKLQPTTTGKQILAIQKTRYATLDRLFRRIHLNKSELLLVLERPEVPLRTNDSGRDIRDHILLLPHLVKQSIAASA